MRKLKLDELGRVDVDTFSRQRKFPIVFVLDNIRSGLNVGSILRSADAFSVDSVVLVGISPKPPHKEILKTAIGASKSVKWTYLEDAYQAIASLKKEGYEVIGIEQTTDSRPLKSFEVDIEKKYALIFGNEVGGLSDEILPHLDSAIEIEQFGTKHSINVAVCAGIVGWHFSQPFAKDYSVI